MKFLYPPNKVRKEIIYRLRMYFRTDEEEFFRAAMNLFFEFYEVEQPKVDWYERLDDIRVAGLTYSTGRIELIAPSAWKSNKKHRTQQRWLEVVFHELYHFLFWVSDEAKAEEYATGFLKK